MAHSGGCNYLPKTRDSSTIGGLGVFNKFAVVHPEGALDGDGRLRQVAVQDGRSLVDDLRWFRNNVWGLR